MIKIRIEATDPFSTEEPQKQDCVEITQASANADSTISEFVDLFCRAMLGLSFTKNTIIKGLENKVEEEKEEEC